jgi:hypothetical protein
MFMNQKKDIKKKDKKKGYDGYFLFFILWCTLGKKAMTATKIVDTVVGAAVVANDPLWKGVVAPKISVFS